VDLTAISWHCPPQRPPSASRIDSDRGARPRCLPSEAQLRNGDHCWGFRSRDPHSDVVSPVWTPHNRAEPGFGSRAVSAETSGFACSPRGEFALIDPCPHDRHRRGRRRRSDGAIFVTRLRYPRALDRASSGDRGNRPRGNPLKGGGTPRQPGGNSALPGIRPFGGHVRAAARSNGWLFNPPGTAFLGSRRAGLMARPAGAVPVAGSGERLRPVDAGQLTSRTLADWRGGGRRSIDAPHARQLTPPGPTRSAK
jgi:hypothetical protein